MKFEESKFIDLTNIPKVFVYFLLDKKEVVYIGQTKKGLTRVYIHQQNKKFDEIYVIPCVDQKDLDYTEGYFILKYRPKYNINYATPYLLKTSVVLKKLNRRYGTKISPDTFNKILKELNIELKTVPNSYDYYITVEDFDNINCTIDDYKKGAPLNEIFNI